MIDDQLVLKIERLRDELEELKATLKQKYSSADRPVTSTDMRERAMSIAERWLVSIASSPMVGSALGDDAIAERNIHFQRLLTYGERNTQRRKYDQALVSILKNFRAEVIVPLKSLREKEVPLSTGIPRPTHEHLLRHSNTIFIGQSFSEKDKVINDTVRRFFSAFSFTILTGEKPRADTVSRKVKDRIDQADVFIGIFTKRDKIENKSEWTTSAWVIDEKAYAVAKNKKLILLREQGVISIGGLQGDYEYLEFKRKDLSDLVIRLVEIVQSDS